MVAVHAVGIFDLCDFLFTFGAAHIVIFGRMANGCNEAYNLRPRAAFGDFIHGVVEIFKVSDVGPFGFIV